MKKFICILVSVVLVVLAGYLSFDYLSYFANPVLKELPIYRSKEYYSSGFWLDYSDYAKFSYKNVTEEDFQSAESFSKTTEEDVEIILNCVENFEIWVEMAEDELKANYDFDKSVVSVGNYAYIENYSPQSAEYDIYYFDLNGQKLYYFHNDI